jgi:hypothetical protein
MAAAPHGAVAVIALVAPLEIAALLPGAVAVNAPVGLLWVAAVSAAVGLLWIVAAAVS